MAHDVVDLLLDATALADHPLLVGPKRLEAGVLLLVGHLDYAADLGVGHRPLSQFRQDVLLCRLGRQVPGVTAGAVRMTLLRALVVEVELAAPAGAALGGHERSTLPAPDEPLEQEDVGPLVAEVSAPLAVAAQNLLHLVEQARGNDRLVPPIVQLALVLDFPKVRRVGQDADHVHLVERLAAPLEAASGSEGRLAVPGRLKVLDDLAGRAESPALLEDLTDEGGLGVVDLRHPLVVRVRDVPDDAATAGQTLLGAVEHGRSRPLARLLPLQFGEHEDQLEHGPTNGRAAVEVLVE